MTLTNISKLEGSMGIDPAFGSSNFAITITALVDDKVRVVYSEEFERPDHMTMVELCAELIEKYRCVHVYADGANPGFISSLNSSLGEDSRYIEAIAKLQKNHAKPELNMKVLPVNFFKEHKQILQNLKMMLSDGLLAIDKRFEKLITSLNTASDIENSLQKQSMSNSDSLDSLRLALSLYEYS